MSEIARQLRDNERDRRSLYERARACWGDFIASSSFASPLALAGLDFTRLWVLLIELEAQHSEMVRLIREYEEISQAQAAALSGGQK